MSNHPIKAAAAGLLAATVSSAAFAADFVDEPIIYEQPAPIYAEPVPVVEEGFGSWYIRGDVGYVFEQQLDDIEYITYGFNRFGVGAIGGTRNFATRHLDDTYSLSLGVGANITSFLRADITGTYFGKSDFRGSTDCGVDCASIDKSELETWLLLANAYVDLGTYAGFTPYVGAGIGGAYVKWDQLSNYDPTFDETFYHNGNSQMRFAYSLMAGASYCVTEALEADLGYRYTSVEGGKFFDYNERIVTDSFGNSARYATGGPGFDGGLDIHEVRAGLRYNFGAPNRRCEVAAAPLPVIEPEPIIYK